MSHNDFLEKIKKDLKKEEGCVTHMYLDTRGYVTVGVGSMLADISAAQALRFVKRATTKPASIEEIAREFTALKQQPMGKVASFYKAHTFLDLPEEEITAQLDRQIASFERALRERFPRYDEFPVSAKRALLDMAFNLGVSGLLKKFPKLIANAEAQNWEVCAAECRRTGIGEARNDATKESFIQAMHMA